MVSVSRDDVLKYGALLLIVVFVGETVFLGLSNNNSSAHASATPGAVPISFSGQANVSGKVLQLGSLGLAVCPSVPGIAAALKNQSGVSNALFASAEVLAIQFKANASLDAVRQLVFRSCGAPMFRSAVVDLPGRTVVLKTANGTQDVSTRQLDAYFSAQGVSGFQAFVSPALVVGDAVNVSIAVVVQDNRFVSVVGQQPQDEILALEYSSLLSAIKTVPSNATAAAINASVSDGSVGSNHAPVDRSAA